MVVVEVKRPRNHSTPPSKCPDSILTPESEEDTEGEMDVDRPEPSHPGQVQEWLAGLSPVIPAQSVIGNDEEDVRSDENNTHPEDSGGMELDRPGEFGLFLQLAPDLILVPIAVEPEPKVEGPTEEEMLARSARQKSEKVAEERAAAEQANEDPQIKVLLAQLHARREEIKAKLVKKPKKFIMKELPPDAILLAEPPTGFWSRLRPDGIVKFVSDDNDEPVASGSGTRLDPDLKED